MGQLGRPRSARVFLYRPHVPHGIVRDDLVCEAAAEHERVQVSLHVVEPSANWMVKGGAGAIPLAVEELLQFRAVVLHHGTLGWVRSVACAVHAVALVDARHGHPIDVSGVDGGP